uniref:hydroxyacid-oxoacid transhydrogenase n=1 Tax=Strigamia maritima TaxID=126957 RepID=T1JMW0_STRMM
MSFSSIRYGPGVTQEVGKDLSAIGAKKVCIMTDPYLATLPPLSAVKNALSAEQIFFDIYKKIRIEPTDKSFKDAINYAKQGDYDAFVALGGGSVIDTCKAANLYSTNSDAQFLDYVNKPIGKGKGVTHKLKPLIAIPTTSGTGSETTCIAIFDYEPLKTKTGIASRALKPTLALVDPLHTLYMHERVCANSGFDVLCHALESYTALRFNEREPRPESPDQRPVYQGSNPISDIWSLEALRIIKSFFKRAVYNNDDVEARSKMHLASSLAGIGFGNAGVHLCHGMSYPVSGMVKNYKASGYNAPYPIV